ncbi:MAG: regulatory protein RecX [Caldisericia bacterium]|jgi:regulatory protein|nr:RecX family transcriptional regulator [Caldisericia bacterium]MDD3427339.1 regulatory protein RecX [Caldisericia bacterium]MDD5688707.1 regulatory protein RecX [Caldisericia bacterium]HOJ16061.1 regulatory protein RecX [Caldisericia bacterium]HOW02852.1 regulatory protein RecX [Caldisericia bacterium]
MKKVENDAFKIALNLISRRPYFSFELSKKLIDKGFNQNEVNDTINRLIKSLLISDEERFKELINYYQNVRKFGINRIKYELFKRGAERELIDDMIEKYYSFEAHNKIQNELIEKKKGELINEEQYKAKQKIYTYLKRRGF